SASCFSDTATTESYTLSLHDALPILIMEGKDKEARDLLDWYLQIFGRDRFFLELQEHDIEELKPVNNWLIEVGKKDNFRFVATRSEEHTSELQSRENLVCRLLLEKKK